MALWRRTSAPPSTRPRRTHFFWLSFVAPADGGRRLLGCTVVKASDMDGAVRASWRLGLNPGGDVLGCGIEDDGTLQPDHLAFMLNRLRSRAELEREGVI